MDVAIGSGATLHLTERFSRVDEDSLRYEFTIEDPATFTRPFTVMFLMRKNPGLICGYACHEGNYGMIDILAGARAKEKTAEK